MRSLGKLLQIWRYPVKSMGGECVNSAVINGTGVAGDRCWAVLNGETGEICHAKRWAKLLNYRACLLAGEDLQVSGFGVEVPNVNVCCPDGEVIAGRDPGVEKFLSAKLGKPVTLAPLAQPGDIDHYRLAKARTIESTATEMQLLEGEAFPDISSMPEALMIALADYVTPPGTYVDAFPLHLITTNSLQYLSERGNVEAVAERYRPNLLIEPSLQLAEMTENSWLDCRVSVGEAILHIHSRTVRCSMPSREQQWCDIKAEPKMARAMVDHCDRHLGVNVMVEKGGTVSAGDELLWVT